MIVAWVLILAATAGLGFAATLIDPYLSIAAPIVVGFVFAMVSGVMEDIDTAERGALVTTSPHAPSAVRGAILTILLYPLYVVGKWAINKPPTTLRELL